MNMLRRSSFLLFVGLSAFLLLSAAPDAVAAEPGTVTMTLTAVKKDAEPPAVKREDVQLYSKKDGTKSADGRGGKKLNLAAWLDNSLNTAGAPQGGVLK